MNRLLWEEWHEFRWYLLGILVGPWALNLLTSTDFGYALSTRGYDPMWSGYTMMLALIPIVWGATRMPGEFKADAFNMQTLPARSWRIWWAKLLPGLATAILLPISIHIVAVVRIHPMGNGSLQLLVGNIITCCSAYLAAFAIGMLTSGPVAAILAWLCVIAWPFASQSILRGLTFVYPNVIACMGVMALVMSIMVWKFARSRSIGAMWVLTAISACVGVLAFLGLDYAAAGIACIGHGRFIIPVGIIARESYSSSIPGTDFYSEFSEACPGKSGIAYRKALWGGPTRSVYLGESIRVQTRDADRLVVKAYCAMPMAWFPNGDLLVGACEANSTTKVLVWDHLTGRTSMLAKFPTGADRPGEVPVLAAVPNADGSKIALLVFPNRGVGVDLLVLGRNTRRTSVIYPSLIIEPSFPLQRQIVWRGDTIVFRSALHCYWSIRSDGSHLAPVTRYREGG